MIVRILLVSLIAAAMIFTTFGFHFIVTPIQAKTSNHDDNSQTHIKAKTSNHDDNSQTIRVNCSDLAGVLATLNQAHAELTPSGKTNLDLVLSQEGVATSYDSFTHQLDIMAQQVHDTCPQASSNLVKGSWFW
jgi:hypothetical protein